MKKDRKKHIVVVSAFVFFIVLGLACASTPSTPSAPEITYTEVPYSELWESMRQVNSPGKGFIVEAYFNRTNAPSEGSFSIVSDPTVRETYWINGHDRSYRGYRGPYETYADTLQVERYNDQTYKRIDKNKKYKIYISLHDVYDERDRWVPIIDRIEGLMSLEEVAAIEAQEETDRKAAEEARKVQEEQAKKTEQTRLANLYRQAGNNFGNLRNTSRRYGTTFGNDYLTTTYDFGDGNYLKQSTSILGLSFSPSRGTYRVNGDTVIFLSSEGEYSSGTIVGTALNINGDIYR